MLGSKRLDASHTNSASEEERQAARKLLQATVETEKQRLWDAEGPRGTAKTQLGKQIQRTDGASRSWPITMRIRSQKIFWRNSIPKGRSRTNYGGRSSFTRPLTIIPRLPQIRIRYASAERIVAPIAIAFQNNGPSAPSRYQRSNPRQNTFFWEAMNCPTLLNAQTVSAGR